MAGLVLELQRDALDAGTSVGDLLRKAAVVSRKLALKEVDDWLLLEMEGYGNKPCPEYRKVYGNVMYHNPFNGWQPIIFGDTKTQEAFSRRSMSQSVIELEDLLKSNSKKFIVNFPGDQERWLMSQMDLAMQPVLHVSRQAVLRIVSFVRQKLLDWSLDLENRGILGEGLTFTREEKAVAQQVSYHTHIGEMNNSQVQVNSSGVQTYNAAAMKDLPAFMDAMTNAVGKLRLNTSQKEELEAEIATLRAQLASPRPKPSIVREGLRSMKTILEGAAGNVVASGLLERLTPLLAMLPA